MSLLVHKTSYENAKHNVVPGGAGFPKGVFSSFGYGNFFADGELSLFTVTGTYDWNKPFSEATESLFEFWTLDQNKWKKKENVFIDDFVGSIHNRKALVADFNGDGIPDIFVVNHGYDKPPFPGEKNNIVLSQGSGRFLVKHAAADVGFFHGASAVDVDLDGDIDVVAVTGGTGGPTMYTFLNDGSGNFVKDENNLLSVPLPVNRWGGSQYYTIEFIDVNDDGAPDLFLGGHEDDGAATLLFLNPGNFDFSRVSPIVIPAVPGEGVVLDFLVTNTIEGKDVWILRTSGGDGNFYQSTVLQKFSLPSLSSEIVFDEHDGAWIPWILAHSKNGQTFITSQGPGSEKNNYQMESDKLLYQFESDKLISNVGGYGIDLFTGGGGADTIIGNTGNNIITGGGGNDTIIGGGGTDIAVFSGIFRDYNITKLTGNSFTVQDTRGIDGTDLLQDISTFRFSDVDKSFQDILTGIIILDSTTDATQVTGNDGIIDRFVLQTNSAPSTPFKITAFNSTEDILQIPQELASGIAQRTFFGVAKVVVPDRTLTKRERKSFKKQQKAVNKQVKRIGRTGDGFAYNQMTGQLFIDTNGRKKGFGEGGGLLAILEDTPAIGIDNFQFL